MKNKDSKTEKPSNIDIVNGSFPSILKLVEEGWNIMDATAEFGICRSVFYRYMTPTQKQEIYAAKKLHTKYGVGSRSF